MINDLAALSCEPCKSGAELLSKTESEVFLAELDGWEIIEESTVKKLKRVFYFRDYAQSMSFVNEVAELAERANHHPEMLVAYGSVAVTWWTHAINGLHKNDFIMAAKTLLAASSH